MLIVGVLICSISFLRTTMDRAVSEVKDLPEHNIMEEVSSTGFCED